MDALSGAVLAGGRSTRMGRDKAWIVIDGQPLVEIVVERLSLVCGDVTVVAKDPLPFIEAGLDAVSDGSDDDGPLVGIAAALRVAAHDRVAVVAVDMPFVSPALITRLAELPGDVVVPVLDGHLQALHAIWSKALLPEVEAALAEGLRSPTDLIKRVHAHVVDEADWRAVDPSGASMIDLDRPEDLP